VYSLGSVLLIAKATIESDIAAAVLEGLFLSTGGLVGFYAFIMYCLANEDVRNIWKVKLKCAERSFPRPNSQRSSLSKKKQTTSKEKIMAQSPLHTGTIKDSDRNLEMTITKTAEEVPPSPVDVDNKASIDV
jgi:hypothetical protein